MASGLKIQNYNLKFKNFQFWIVILHFTFYILHFTGCATAPYVLPPKSEISLPGIYHRVEKGETLWRISKIYNIDLNEIISINHIGDATDIDVGQLIFMPYRKKIQTLSFTSSHEDFIWPTKGKVITAFGQIYNNMINKGINIQVYANQDVVATRSGKVIFYNNNFRGFGKTVIIDHGDRLSTIYARNSQVFVKVGDSVERGTVIAKVGYGGKDKNAYLHFEIRKDHIPQNPYFYLLR